MGSFSKFFADHNDLLAEAFDLDEESNLVEKDHISVAAVEKLVHDLLVNEMQEILTELVLPYDREQRGYRRLQQQMQTSNPDQGVWHELPPAGGATGGATGAAVGGGRARQAGAAGTTGQPMQAGVGGSIPTQVVSILKGRGWSDAAIKGALANAMAEGGLSEPWKKSGIRDENSFGLWQFNKNGELPGYYAWAKQNGIANPDGHIAGQTNYMASRVESMIPGYAQHTDPRTATDDMHIKFERPANKTPGTRYQHLDVAQQHFDTAMQNIASGNTGQQTATATPRGNERFDLGNRAGNLNQTLVQSVRAGSSYLPDGYSVRVTSGERPGAHVHGGGGPSQHSSGNAVDVHIVGPNGQVIPNRGEDTTGMYGTLARGSYHELLKTNPNMAGKMAWGGNFTTSASGGDKDLMHIDLGGDRGRFGSLSQQYQQHAQTDNFDARAQQATQVAQAKPSSTPVSGSAIAATSSDKIAALAKNGARPTVTPQPTPPPSPDLQASTDKIAALAKNAGPQTTPPPVPPTPVIPPPVQTPPPTQTASTAAPTSDQASTDKIAAIAKNAAPQTTLVSWAVPTRKRLGISLLRS